MTIKEILDRSSKIDQFCQKYSLANQEVNIFGTLKYEAENIGELMENVIYVTDTEKLPKKLQGTGYYNFLICVNDLSKNLDLSNMIKSRCNILFTLQKKDEALSKVEHILFDERRIESAMRRITEALFASGLKKMIEVGAEQIKCPLMLVKSSGEIIEKNIGIVPENICGQFKRFWTENTADGLISLADNCEEDTEYLSSKRIPGARVFQLFDGNIMVIVLPIRISKIEVGKLFGFFEPGEFPGLECELLYRLSLVIGDELQRHNNYHIGRRQRYINFMWMILEGKYPNMQAIQSSMDELGISFKGKCRICVLHIVNDNDELIYINDMLDIISSQVAARMPHVLWIIHNNELVLLFNIEKNADISDADYNFLYKLTKDNNISAGMSYEFYSLAGAGQLYWQAKQAAEFGHELLGKRLTKFEEVSHFSMFQLIQKNMDPMVYVDPGLMQLLNEGKENVHESFNTLYWYLKYGGNTNEVAAKTHMHRNTVLYRVDKLHQRMNFDLNNGISVMKLMLSFEILKYLKLFQPDE